MASASTTPLVVESAIDEAAGAASPRPFGLGAKLEPGLEIGTAIRHRIEIRKALFASRRENAIYSSRGPADIGKGKSVNCSRPRMWRNGAVRQRSSPHAPQGTPAIPV